MKAGNTVRRMVSLLISAVFILTVMAGCGSSNTPKTAESPSASSSPSQQPSDSVSSAPVKEFANKELSVAVFEGGYGKDYWEAVKEKFEADYPGVKINLTSNPKIMDMIKPNIVVGNPPDFIYIPPGESTGTIQAMLKDKQLLDLTDVFTENALDSDKPLRDKLIDGILDYAKPLGDGKIYYAPSYLNTMGIIFNKTLFEQKGWQVPETWDEFLALGEVAKQEDRSLYTYQGIYPSYNEMLFFPTIASAGGAEAINQVTQYEEGAFKSEAVKKTMELFNTISQKDYLMKGTVALNHTQAQTEFMQGKALFIPNGTWMEQEMQDAPREEGFEFGFMAPPAVEAGGERYVLTGFEAMYIPAKAKNIELAKEFLRYQYNDDIIALNAEKSKGVMAVKNGAEIAKPYISPMSYDSMKIFDSGVKPVMYQWKVTPKTEINIVDEVFNPISNIMNKDMTVEQWADRVETATAKLRDTIQAAGQ